MLRYCIQISLAALLAAPPASGWAQSREMTDRDGVALPRSQSPGELSQPDLAEVVQQIVEQTNAFRGERGLPSLQQNEQLTAAAEYFARYMARTGKYGHTADGKRPAERAAEHDYDYCIVLENIAYQQSTAGFETAESAERFFSGWKQSEGHRENMLDPDVQEIGVAVAAGEPGQYFAVQMFGRPQSAAVEFNVTNQSGQEAVYQLLTSDGSRDVSIPPRATATHTRCRPPQLRLAPADGEQAAEPLKVDRGDRFVITGAEGQLQLQRAAEEQSD